jgi:hypothetical protein
VGSPASTSAATVSTTETVQAFIHACQTGREVDSAIDDVGSPRIRSARDVGGESRLNGIVKLRGGLGAPGVANQPSEEVSVAVAAPHASLNADTSALQPTCGCGCGAYTPIAKKSDRRTGAIAGQPQKFIKGHVARLRPKLDITPEKFWGRVEKFEKVLRLPALPLPPAIQEIERQAAALALVRQARRGGPVRPARGTDCLLYPCVQITVAGHRVYARHAALLLHQGLSITADALKHLKALGPLRRYHRCHRRCVNPDHTVVLRRESSEDIRRRAEAIRSARARMAASRATT